MTAPASIVCPKCGIRSHNPGDVQHRFCARCGWHDDIRRAAELRARGGVLVVAMALCPHCGSPYDRLGESGLSHAVELGPDGEPIPELTMCLRCGGLLVLSADRRSQRVPAEGELERIFAAVPGLEAELAELNRKRALVMATAPRKKEPRN